MICTIYRHEKGFILVPDCIKASREAGLRFGPLRSCGTVDTGELAKALAASIEEEVTRCLYAPLSPELALRLGYQLESVPALPSGFAWQEGDGWNTGGERALVYGPEQIVVATVKPLPDVGWLATANCHRPAALHISQSHPTRAAAIDFVAAWAGEHADTVRAGLGIGLH
ncbi:hypothetical protein ACFPN1_13840 [Lysobacter yangpyeongensis]|uniref:Uncharacterized protein n=1 Tax=Lysobacter yangpyeongensis TaxID=346182 RepID=A0ABW0SPU6_9GAMM